MADRNGVPGEGNVRHRFRFGLLLSLLSAALIAASDLSGANDAFAQAVPESRQQIELSFAPVVRIAAPAVVNIYSRRIVQARGSPLFDDPFFRQFFGSGTPFGMPKQRVENSLGSGVIVGADGIIVTNHHVVAGADEITVVLADRREYAAKVVGSDERTDLAVLKIDVGGDRLPTVAFRDSDTVEVGDLVLAIGNPFGVGQTVTSGIVSAEAQTRVGIADVNFFIQTDAAINPGNSGGALVDMQGRLVGINTAIYSRTGGSLGIGFAIPANMVRLVVDGFTRYGRIERPWIGAWGREVNGDVAHALGLPRPEGVLVEEIYPGGPADDAGIRTGDVVLAINGRTVDDPQALRYRVATLPIGGSAVVTLWRDGKERSVTMPVQKPPEDPPRAALKLSGSQPLAGATIANLSPAVADEMGLGRHDKGIVVTEIESSSPADRLGLQVGDRIVSVNGEAPASTTALRRQMDRRAGRWQIVIGRGDQKLSVIVGD
ncbi:MAG: DegQ family serine endoprotease [Rhodospirillales bacterium]|nr:DegQ family serine endoprotease [Rhodospirillales bacterium]